MMTPGDPLDLVRIWQDSPGDHVVPVVEHEGTCRSLDGDDCDCVPLVKWELVTVEAVDR